MIVNLLAIYYHLPSQILPLTFARNRYQLLTKFPRFDNFHTGVERKLVDELALIVEIVVEVVLNCEEAFKPHMCNDEQLR